MTFKMRFVASMTVVSLFGAMLEYSRFNAQKRLRKMAEKFHDASRTDELTALANRRAINQAINDEVVRVGRTEKNFVLLMFDVDFFKGINDQYGHNVGDFALKHLAGCFRNNLREYDIPSRWGGEEFMVLMPETEVEMGKKVAERIRKTISETPLETDTGDLISMTVSCGGSSWAECRSVEVLIKKADERLYNAKQRGRNRVVWGC
jgi:diguanylate cyclase (GGDEF)-like protein